QVPDQVVDDDGGQPQGQFVHGDHVGSGHQCPPHGNHLLLSARKRSRTSVAQIVQGGQNLVDVCGVEFAERHAPRRRLSSTVRSAKSWRPSGTWARAPSMWTRPEVGRSTPDKVSTRVDFPAPLGPTRATSSPWRTVSDTPFRAVAEPSWTTRSSTVITRPPPFRGRGRPPRPGDHVPPRPAFPRR